MSSSAVMNLYETEEINNYDFPKDTGMVLPYV